ncbi:sensor histidine kinase [Novosphingobium sp.]|uniref:sensor histidine kinase n=1 Tax=Novosphingobium sp. TaxID=1874826 RepID=UPI003B521814
MFATLGKDRSYRTAIARFMTVGFAALLGVILSAGVLLVMGQRQSRWIVHTYEVQSEITSIRLAVTQLIGVKLGNRLHLMHQADRHTDTIKATLDRNIATLARMTKDNPRQQARIPLLMASAAQVEGQAGLDVPVDARIGRFSDDPAERVTALCATMLAEETLLMEHRYKRRGDIANALYVILGLTAVLLIIVALLAYTTLRSYTREIDLSHQALRAANEGLEGAVQERTADLVRANAEIQRFAYIVSHDLRSPLVNIMGFTAEIETATQALRDELDNTPDGRALALTPVVTTIMTEEMPEAIDFIRTSAMKMDRLINAILQLSRLGARKLSPRWQPLRPLVQSVTDTLQTLLNQAGGTVVLADPMPDVFVDSVALEQILANLIENAIKYRSPARVLHIDVSAQRVGDRIAIAVADNGRGIDPRDSDRVFDLFRRSGMQDQPGEGIGLAHVRALAYRLGGTIGLESTLGTGSTFTLNLPVHFDEDAPEDTVTQSDIEPGDAR